MIENLNGIYETVNFQKLPSIKLYDNDKYENYPPHWHTPLEILMPLKNWYDVACGGQTFRLREKDIAVIAPGTIHTLTAPEKGERLIFQPDCSPLRDIKELDTIFSLLAPLAIITPENYPAIHGRLVRLMMDVREEYFSTHSFTEPLIYGKVIEMLVLLGRNYTESGVRFEAGITKQREYSEKFLAICDYINAHCTEDLTLDFAANLAGFSKYHFTRLFKQFTGVSFYRFLNQKRIMHAEALLARPEYTVTEAAIQSGFSSMSAFIRMFRQLKGCTPTEFRTIYSPEFLAAAGSATKTHTL